MDDADPVEAVRAHVDALAEGEWDRLVRSPRTRVVSDVSPVQLRLDEVKVTEAGREAAVEDRLLVDVRDLGAFDDASFDAVVAYGGSISCAFDRAEEALGGCLRVTRPGGVVPCRMFRWRELQEMFGRQPCVLLAASASNAASTGDPAALDGGTHTIFALRRT